MFLDAGDLGRLSQTSKHMLSLCFDEVGLMVGWLMHMRVRARSVCLFVCLTRALTHLSLNTKPWSRRTANLNPMLYIYAGENKYL